MSYSVTCADSGADCPGQFTTETKEELMQHLQVHVEASHPGLEMTQDQIDGLVRSG